MNTADFALPQDDEAADFLIWVTATSLALVYSDNPANQEVARRAAERTMACYRPTDEADLLLTAQMVAFGVAALRTQGLGLRSDLAPAEARRLLTCAAGCIRAQERIGKMRAGRTPLPVENHPREGADIPPVTMFTNAPADAPATPRAMPMPATKTAPMPAARSAQPVAADHFVTPEPELPAEQSATASLGWSATAALDGGSEAMAGGSPIACDSEAWADAAEQAAQAYLTVAPNLTPVEKKQALENARLLGNAARDVRAGLPPPMDLQLLGRGTGPDLA